MIFALLSMLSVGNIPAVGQTAPDFAAVDTEGKSLTLSELLKNGPVVLAFFPKAFTPGCTAEMKSWTTHHDDLGKYEGQLVVISTDTQEKQAEFKKEMKASWTFVADSEGKITELYDVKMPIFMIAKRRTFVIGQDGKIVAVHEGNDAIESDVSLKSLNACTAPKTTVSK